MLTKIAVKIHKQWPLKINKLLNQRTVNFFWNNCKNKLGKLLKKLQQEKIQINKRPSLTVKPHESRNSRKCWPVYSFWDLDSLDEWIQLCFSFSEFYCFIYLPTKNYTKSLIGTMNIDLIMIIGLNLFKLIQKQMHNHGLNTLLEEFAAQRKYRQTKRKQFLRRFEQLKTGFGGNSHPRAHVQQEEPRSQIRQSKPEHQQPQRQVVNHVPPQQRIPAANPEEQALIKENRELKQKYGELESIITDEMRKFQTTVNNTKDVYVAEIAKIVESSNKSKVDLQKKMSKLKEQTQAALIKNKEIEAVNVQIQKQLDNLSGAGPNFDEIRKQYDDKLTSFQAIFASSNEKIEALEKEFNEEQFIETTMKNEDLLKNIEENAEKAAEAAKILEDYRSLNDGKKEILFEIQNNNEMKEKEITKMCELEEKMKVIMDKLNKEKQAIVSENNRMAKELMEIKELLMATVGQGN